ncbi:hybrid sensor histidine kinase/response regulator transcription factor [Bacteroides sp. An51A]|uniref:hybrid sensor histidine kinase/response regulator transcription factor n=1 Tax=Bacteroides sp. An51A TaxID=1965640 RepID=UPI000B370C3A|nr:hybrid sensor histidine kinase/response regulator transcription factor [Bacteroides sp. An51A]OUN81418.1 hybrid sensor histidine kinase/response regulator [Bacteroides sp. An51A]
MKLQPIRNLIAGIVCLVWACTGVRGQVSFAHIGLEDGLSQSTVLSITQDVQGNMWFATFNGVNRFDGYDFTVYRHETGNAGSIGDNMVYAVKADDKGGVWVGTNNWLSYYDADRDAFRNYRCPQKEEDVRVMQIADVDDSRLLVNTSAGLYVFHVADTSFVQSGLPADLFRLEATAIYRSKDSLYIGAKDGLWMYSFASRTLEHLHALPLGRKEILTLLQHGNHLWIGTEGDGLYRMDRTTRELRHYTAGGPDGLSSNFVRSLALDARNRLWVGTFTSLDIYDEETGRFQVYTSNRRQNRSLSQSSIRSIFMDSQGGMWLGTYFGGLNYYHPLRERFRHIRFSPEGNSLNDNVIGCITEDRAGNLWIGTNNGGVNYYDIRSGEYTYYTKEQGLGSNDVKAIYVDEQAGKVYIGTHTGGLNILDRRTGRIESLMPETTRLTNMNVFAIQPCADGRHLWIGTLEGLVHFDKATKTFSDIKGNVSLGVKRIRTLLLDRENRLWVGGEDGLAVCSGKGDSLSSVRMVSGESAFESATVYGVFEASDGDIWIATRNGLYGFSAGRDSVVHYSVADGMPDAIVYGVLEDEKHRLWISTDNGLSCFDPESRKFRNFTDVDGLQSNQFTPYACCLASSGEMYFGGINGITAFHPERLQDNPYAPRAVISELRLFGDPVHPNDQTGILQKHISLTDRITLNHKQSSFALSFVVSNYIAGKHNTFAYKLDGYDKRWFVVDDNQRWATYANLPHGTYNFLVKVANNDGKWCDEVTSLEIKVLPAWYQTWWAIALFALMIIGVITLVIRFYWERADKVRQKELQEVKTRFFINISHELRTPLTLIVAPLQDLLDKVTDKWVRSQLEYMKRNTDRLLHLVNQLMDYRRAEKGVFELRVKCINVGQIVEKNFRYYEPLARKKHIDYNLRSELGGRQVWCDASYIELILNNLLSNAFKYTNDGQSISVNLKTSGDDLLLQVQDTGVGIPVNKQAKIFERFYQVESEHIGSGIGLSLVQKLVELHHGRIEVDSAVGKGSCFSVYLPLSREAYAEEELSGGTQQEEPVYSTNARDMYIVDTEEALEPAESDVDTDRKETILVVEDNDEIRHYMSRGLERFFIVKEVENGEEAVELLKTEEISLILTDVMMPVMDGIQLCKYVKQNLKTCHIPVIILSAKAEVKDQLDGLQVGADDYIAKPFSLSVVVMKIKNILRTHYRAIEHYSKSLEIEPEKIALNRLDEEFLSKAVSVVEKNLEKPDFSADDFALEMGMSRSSLHLKMKGITGESTTEFIRKIRFNQACKLLKEGRYNVAEISTMVGFSTPSYFSTSFKKYIGCMPSEYAKGGAVQQK